ncbi:hypothetical protein E4U42_002700 [Claviceps africana]|uniref:SSCRP protein n=1 Tax=Claviceps africana TaxID=83212 RepID=A0A8K0NM37_9HYPO|nr:hypothetical protein E4U42_002700 [Claviceps africana]
MHASHVLSVVVLAGAAHALAVRNKHVADFRLFGEQDCYRQNQGIWTVIDDDFRADECKTLGGSLPRSIRNVDMNGGCTLSFYTDDDCTAGRTECAAGQCCISAEGWRAWSMRC